MENIILKTDFKLNANNIYEITRLFNQETGEIFHIQDLELHQKNAKYYVENLNIFFTFLIKYCFENRYKNVETYKKLNKNTFCFNEKNGNCSIFFIRNKKNAMITFINFETKFSIGFSDLYTNKKMIDYAEKKERTSNSIGTDSFNEFLQTCYKCNKITAQKLFRDNFPILKHSLLEIAKNVVVGFQYVKKGKYSNVYNYDITSSYPAQLYNDIPVGKIFEFKTIANIPHTYFFIVRFFAYNIKCKENCFDFLKVKGTQILTLTKQLYKLFTETYDYDFLKEIQVIAFKTRKSLFANFIDNNIVHGKEEETDKDIKKYNKIIANSLVGYFGRNTIKTHTLCNYQNGMFELTKKEYETEPIYLPVYLAVLDSAKAQFIKTLNKFKDDIIYANTDGFLTLKPIDINLLNYNKTRSVGSYKLANIFTDIYINAINGYAGITETGEIENTIAGLTLTDFITPEQYESGHYQYTVKTITDTCDLCLTICNM